MAVYCLDDLDDKTIALFERYALKGSDPDDCWHWAGPSSDLGYPRISKTGGYVSGTHASLILNGRNRPVNGDALHSCDNPPCTNPKHLRWGDDFDNMQDKKQRGRGRWLFGEGHPKVKLTDEQVAYIKASKSKGVDLAAHFAVSTTLISKIRRGRMRKTVLSINDDGYMSTTS